MISTVSRKSSRVSILEVSKQNKNDFVIYILSLFIQSNFYTHFYEINHITVAADEDIPK